jgi:type I restriction enzyme S subunit
LQDATFVEEATKNLTGTSGLRRVPKSFVENRVIGIPPLALQQEFAEKIEAIEKQKELIKQSITQTEELFNARMAYYFD